MKLITVSTIAGLLVVLALPESTTAGLHPIKSFAKGFIAGVLKSLKGIEHRNSDRRRNFSGSASANLSFGGQITPHGSGTRQNWNGARVDLTGNLDVRGQRYPIAHPDGRQTIRRIYDGNLSFDANITKTLHQTATFAPVSPISPVVQVTVAPTENVLIVKPDSLEVSYLPPVSETPIVAEPHYEPAEDAALEVIAETSVAESAGLNRAEVTQNNKGATFTNGAVNINVANAGSGTGAIINFSRGFPRSGSVVVDSGTVTTDFSNGAVSTDFNGDSTSTGGTDDNFSDFGETVDSMSTVDSVGTPESSSSFFNGGAPTDTFDSLNGDTTTFDDFGSAVETTADTAFDDNESGDPFSSFDNSDTSTFDSGSSVFTDSEVTSDGTSSYATDAGNGFTSGSVSVASASDLRTGGYEVHTMAHASGTTGDDVETTVSVSGAPAEVYDKYVQTNIDSVRELSDIALNHGNGLPITIQLRTRHRVETPTHPETAAAAPRSYYVQGIGSLSADGSSVLLPDGNWHMVRKAPLLYKFREVIESPDATPTATVSDHHVDTVLVVDENLVEGASAAKSISSVPVGANLMRADTISQNEKLVNGPNNFQGRRGSNSRPNDDHIMAMFARFADAHRQSLLRNPNMSSSVQTGPFSANGNRGRTMNRHSTFEGEAYRNRLDEVLAEAALEQRSLSDLNRANAYRVLSSNAQLPSPNLGKMASQAVGISGVSSLDRKENSGITRATLRFRQRI
ncbi:uncharacterized protein LOC108673000 isoform X2 [Hyalella azteca]|uniref:Uncharacterized protein LOC108673000 isoform X2 n=1 Tax=Hyalella azteca TaxID=294128 RepID=A0A8B7NR87_HYAAZ|nr:uncharacterized protein LOC108673000 isoform X2 [Hyalella azteca]